MSHHTCKQRYLLEDEGVSFKQNGYVDLKNVCGIQIDTPYNNFLLSRNNFMLFVTVSPSFPLFRVKGLSENSKGV